MQCCCHVMGTLAVASKSCQGAWPKVTEPSPGGPQIVVHCYTAHVTLLQLQAHIPSCQPWRQPQRYTLNPMTHVSVLWDGAALALASGLIRKQGHAYKRPTGRTHWVMLGVAAWTKATFQSSTCQSLPVLESHVHYPSWRVSHGMTCGGVPVVQQANSFETKFRLMEPSSAPELFYGAFDTA